MKAIGISISVKLLVLILPLVCIPIAIVGFLSFRTSLDSVTLLERDAQLLQAKVAAAKIEAIFQSCRMDLDTIAKLLWDIFAATGGRRLGPNEFQRQKINELFSDFLSRSPYYFGIELMDASGMPVMRVGEPHPDTRMSLLNSRPFLWESVEKSDRLYYTSEIFSASPGWNAFINFATFLESDQYPLTGAVVIHLDFDKVIELVTDIRIGEKGYAFLVDQRGRIIAHPSFKPYEYDLTKYDDPRLREFVIAMIIGETGWKVFNDHGEKAAAYAPVSATRWSLAVTVPIEEFVRAANELRSVVIQVVLLALVLSGFAVAIISYQLLKPVKNLALATERVALGDLSKEIPVKSRDELGMLTRSFNQMIRSLRDIQTELVASEKLAGMGRLSAGVAHEIRNPLNAMKGAIAVLQRRRAADALVKEYSDLILEEIERLSQFVNEFLFFAKQTGPRKVPTHLDELVANTLLLFDEAFRKKQIRIERTRGKGLPPVDIDPQQMEQVFINLFINAIDAMDDGGCLKIGITLKSSDDGTSGAALLVEIEDSGCGIPSEHLHNIFEPFYSTKKTGTGLGLPISMGIVENHGGHLRLVSRPGEGTRVTIEIPVDNGVVEEDH